MDDTIKLIEDDLIDNASIRGPNNIARLEGSIGGIKKVVYLFFDYHVKESTCTNVYSKSMRKYISDTIGNAHNNITYDIFIEHRLADSKYLDDSYAINNEIYLFELSRLFNKNILKNLNKLRIHYLDIRDSFMINDLFLLEKIDVDVVGKLFVNTVKKLIDTLKKMINCYKQLVNNVPTSEQIKEFHTSDKISYFINKILNVYSDVNVQNINRKIMRSIVDNIERNIPVINTALSKMYDDYTKESLSICSQCSSRNILTYFSSIFAKLTDVYLLRRLADKKYISHSIIYSGAYHSANYIIKLCNDFDFKLTNISYSNGYSISELNTLVKIDEIANDVCDYKFITDPDSHNVTNWDGIMKLCSILENIRDNRSLSQCSSLKNFPSNFE
jgi:hypothetical protein